MEATTTTTEFWIADEPIKYKVRRIEGNGIQGAGVHIVRYEGSDEDCQQAVLEVIHNGDTLRLCQWDGDLDAKQVIEADQRALRGAPHHFSIWRRIWKVATTTEVTGR